MAATAVLYSLKLGGDLAAKLPSLSAGLQKVGRSAQETTASVAAAGTSLRGAAQQGEQASAGLFRAAAAFTFAGVAIHQTLKSNEEYQQSTVRLVNELGRLRASIADAIGPGVAKFIDSFTIGLTYIATLVTGTVGPAFTTLMGIVDIFTERVGESLRAWKLIFAGDFAGAAGIIAGHKEAFQAILAEAKLGFNAIDKARDTAFTAAFNAWREQVDGIKDVADGVRQTVAETKAIAVAPPPQARITSSTSIAPDQATVTPVVSGLDKATAVLEGMGTDTASILKMIPVYGQFLSAIWSLVSQMEATSKNVMRELIDFGTNLDDQLDATITQIPDMLIRALPDLVASLITLIPRLILDLVASGPLLFASLIEALIDMPKTIASSFFQMFAEFWARIKASLDRVTGVLSNKDGQFLGTGLGARSEGNRRFLGIRIPKLDTGGTVTRSGLALVHRGEEFSGVGRHRQPLGGGGSVTNHVTFNVTPTQDVDRFVREVRARLGTLGVGLTLDPRTGI